MIPKPALSATDNRRPSSLSEMRGPLRMNNRQPSACSNVRTCRLTALWVIDNASAARVKEQVRAATSKALSA